MASQTGTLKFRQSDGTYTELYPKTTIAQVDGLQTQLDSINTSLQNKVGLSDLSGGASSILSSNLTASRALVSDESGKVTVSSVTSTQLGYLSGVSSAIQTQLNGKQASITGGASSITTSNLKANKALISNGSGKVAISAVTSTELGYLSGVTSKIQTQLNNKVSTSSMELNIGKFTLVKTFSASSPTYTMTNNDVLGRGFFFDTSSCTLVPENPDVYSMIVKIIKTSESKSILMAQNHIAGGGGQAVSFSALGNTTYSFAVSRAHAYGKYSGTFIGSDLGLVTLETGDGLELKFISCTSSNLTIKMYRIT